MPKQNFNSGSGAAGPHRQGEKGGKEGKVAKAGMSTRVKSEAEKGGSPSRQAAERMAKTPTLSGKSSPRGKGSGNR
jgi:hypothetical protein